MKNKKVHHIIYVTVLAYTNIHMNKHIHTQTYKKTTEQYEKIIIVIYCNKVKDDLMKFYRKEKFSGMNTFPYRNQS